MAFLTFFRYLMLFFYSSLSSHHIVSYAYILAVLSPILIPLGVFTRPELHYSLSGSILLGTESLLHVFPKSVLKRLNSFCAKKEINAQVHLKFI